MPRIIHPAAPGVASAPAAADVGAVAESASGAVEWCSLLAAAAGSWSLVPSDRLFSVLGVLLRLRALAEGAAVAVTLEAHARGLVAASLATDVAGWVRMAAADAGVGVTPAVAGQFRSIAEADRVGSADLQVLVAACRAGRLPVAGAARLVGDVRHISAKVPGPIAATAVATLVECAARGDSARDLTAAREAVIASYGEEGTFEEEQERIHRRRELTTWRRDDLGRWVAVLAVDNLGHALVEAAVNALSAPRALAPVGDCDGGVDVPRDDRTAGQRRADALVELCRAACGGLPASHALLGHPSATPPDDHHAVRVGGVDASPPGERARVRTEPSADVTHSRECPGGDVDHDSLTLAEDVPCANLDPCSPTTQPRAETFGDGRASATERPPRGGSTAHSGWSPRAQIVVTMDVDDLTRGIGYGVDGFGNVLTARQVRLLACQADVIPAVLGGPGALLDLGRRARLASGDQFRALRLRDGGCTFPGCDRPASWCQAHHLRHWLDGGPTDLDNLALLCHSHHTSVHRHGYVGEVHDGRVRWRAPAPVEARDGPTRGPRAA